MVNILIFAGAVIALLLASAIGVAQWLMVSGFVPSDHKLLSPVRWIIDACVYVDDKLVKITFRKTTPDD